ncbi:MAG TPA: hypothetical protein VKQ72_20390 [Aggregatilineales bacterium]|nr:hypothetical protein [Aggregatilineales bacterium]
MARSDFHATQTTLQEPIFVQCHTLCVSEHIVAVVVEQFTQRFLGRFAGTQLAGT